MIFEPIHFNEFDLILKKIGLFEDNPQIALALSGGADSTAVDVWLEWFVPVNRSRRRTISDGEARAWASSATLLPFGRAASPSNKKDDLGVPPPPRGRRLLSYAGRTIGQPRCRAAGSRPAARVHV